MRHVAVLWNHQKEWHYYNAITVEDLKALAWSSAPQHSLSRLLDVVCLLFSFRGTNPFATVKLRPTVTNDRSAPIIR